MKIYTTTIFELEKFVKIDHHEMSNANVIVIVVSRATKGRKGTGCLHL